MTLYKNLNQERHLKLNKIVQNTAQKPSKIAKQTATDLNILPQKEKERIFPPPNSRKHEVYTCVLRKFYFSAAAN